MEDKAKVEENKGVETIELKFGMSNEKLECSKNLGYIILEKIYKSLNIETFFNKKIQKRSDSFSTNDAIKLLTFSRILEPNSKFKTHQLQDYFFKNPFNLKLRNIYDVLDDAFVVKENLQLHLHKQISKLYNRNLSLVFYDVTNYFFETEIEDELRAKGVSKENRETPIVQMGLLMDQQGIPIAYKLFRGNTLDQLTLIETIEEFQKIFNVHSITLVADKGLNSGRNLQYLINHNHKYIVSQMVRTNDEKFREKILDQNGYK
jgi:transposase